MLEEAQAAEPGGGIMKLSFGRLAPPRFCFSDSTTFTETGPRDNTNRSRAAQAAEAESEGEIVKLSFGRLAPPRFCFGNSIVMPDFIRHPVNLVLRFTQGHSERSEESQFNIKSKIYNLQCLCPRTCRDAVSPRLKRPNTGCLGDTQHSAGSSVTGGFHNRVPRANSV